LFCSSGRRCGGLVRRPCGFPGDGLIGAFTSSRSLCALPVGHISESHFLMPSDALRSTAKIVCAPSFAASVHDRALRYQSLAKSVVC
jgi:hypothetical protein